MQRIVAHEIFTNGYHHCYFARLRKTQGWSVCPYLNRLSHFCQLFNAAVSVEILKGGRKMYNRCIECFEAEKKFKDVHSGP